MTDHVFRCEGAPVPRGWSDLVEQHVLGESGGDAPQIDFRLEMPGPLLGALDARSRDLVRIASYVYLADQSVSRGGELDVYGRRWRRRMLMAIAVDDPDFWRSGEVIKALSDALHFLTEDEWQFHFTAWKRSTVSRLQLISTEASLYGDPGCVVLFSGGADSLAASIAAHGEGARPLLVSHRSSPLVASHQQRLIDELRTHFSSAGFRQASAIVHRRGSDAPETSQRSRSFLFASLGAVAAAALGVTDVRLADNGFISINLPITDQAVGAQASRTTHPKFLRLFNELAELVLEHGVEVRNPLRNLTRAEALLVLKDAGVPELLGEARSCAHPRGRTIYAPHCGTCSQCVDRRFGSIAAGMQEYDPSSTYEVDIFRDGLNEGEPRVIATSYLRLALLLEGLSEEDYFLQFPQLYDCITDQRPEEQAREMVTMLKRHAHGVLGAMRDQVSLNAEDIVRGKLPATCLVRLVPMEAGPRSATGPPRGFSYSPDFSTVVFDGKPYALGPSERVGFRVLHEAWKRGTPEVSGEYVLDAVLDKVETRPRSISELFRRSGMFGVLVVQASRRGVYRVNLSEASAD